MAAPRTPRPTASDAEALRRGALSPEVRFAQAVADKLVDNDPDKIDDPGDRAIQDPNALSQPWPSATDDETAAYERGKAEAAIEYRARQEAEAKAIQSAASAFDTDWQSREQTFKASPITKFLRAHELAGSPNDLTITGVADVRVKLGDLREYARLALGEE